MRRGPAPRLRLLAAGAAALFTTLAACGTPAAGPPGAPARHADGSAGHADGSAQPGKGSRDGPGSGAEGATGGRDGPGAEAGAGAGPGAGAPTGAEAEAGAGDGAEAGAAGAAGAASGGSGGSGSAGERREAPAGNRLPPVIDRLPTREQVVFLTYDDGAGRDPGLIDLIRRRRLPVTLFLTDTVAGPGYGHFARLRAVGAGLQNHTLDHPSLRGLPYAGQRAEICGQQRKLRTRFGVRARFLRPPHGTYDTTTLRAAADCGIAAVVLWSATVRPDGTLADARGPREPRPGDIIRVPSDGLPAPSLRERTERLLTELDGRGLTVASLEDHWDATGPPPAGAHRGTSASPSVGAHRDTSVPPSVGRAAGSG